MPNQIERDVYVLQSKVKNPIEYVRFTNAIPIIFHFRDFQIPAGATAQVFVQKPSGLAVYNAATISGNDVTVDVTTQMMAEVGFNKLQIQVMSGEDNLVTFVQPVNVRQNYTDGKSEESKNESNLFDELQEAAQAANTAAEAANSAAEEIEAKAEAGDFSSTVTVGGTTTGEPGSQASVTNSGTVQNPVLDFVIPTGAQGPQGPKGDPGSAEDIDTTPVTFEQASTRDNVASGDTVATLFGKISKWFSDLGTAAFKGVSNVLTQTSDGYVLDARQGNVLYTMIGVLDNLATTAKTNLVAAINECAMKIGNLTELTTDEKTDLVSAINETNAGLSELNSNNAWSERQEIGGSVGLSVNLRYNAYMYQIEVIGVINGSSIPSGGRKLTDLPEGITPPQSTHRYMTSDSRLSIQITTDGEIWLYSSSNISSTQSGINAAFVEPILS